MRVEHKGDRRARRTRTFVSLTGPAGNLGDALIRRKTLDWATHTSDELVVYVGNAPEVWLRQLGVPADAIVLRSKRSVPRWLWLLTTAPPRPVLVFEAGEVPLDRGNALRELVFLGETILVRLKRGVVVRPPRGIRAAKGTAAWLHRRATALSQVALWRDGASAARMRTGSMAPDIGFATRPADESPGQVRDELVVSLRGARPMPDSAWLQAIRDVAADADLRIRTVVQVREDENRASELAIALGGTFDPWGDRDSVAQEALLRERYARARLVVSDRMHVLVLAAIDGAIPAEVVPNPTRKIADAFAAIGWNGISLDADSADVSDMRRFLNQQVGRTAEIAKYLQAARHQLLDIETEIRGQIRRARS